MACLGTAQSTPFQSGHRWRTRSPGPQSPACAARHNTQAQPDSYPSLSRQADDTRLCCKPVSTTAFSSFPAHCKSNRHGRQ